MATSKTALFLLGLVVVATFCVMAAEASTARSDGHKLDVDVEVALQLNLKKCTPGVKVLVHGAVEKAKAVQCAGGKVTALPVLAVHLKVAHLVVVEVELKGKVGRPAVKVQVEVNVAKLAKVVNGVHLVALELVEDSKHKAVNVLCGKVHLKTISLVDVFLGGVIGVHL